MKPLNIKKIAEVVNGQLSNFKVDFTINEVSTDTRNIEENSLFIALKGDNFDGHEYVNDAFIKGCACAIIDKPVSNDNDNVTILVNDTLSALKKLASYYRDLFPIKAVAITGSVGKTTTKDIIYELLQVKYNVLKTMGNFNNEIGVPKTIFRLDDSYDLIVVEMGMNNFNEIHELSKIVKPNVCVITNIGDGHIENLGSKKGVLNAKMEIIDYMQDDGVLIINGDDELLKDIEIDKKVIKVGLNTNDNLSYIGNNIVKDGINGVKFDLEIKESKSKIDDIYISIPGIPMVTNCLIGIAVAKQFDITDGELILGINNIKAPKMRMEILKNKKGTTIINDVYNANPTSMKASIDVLKSSKNDGLKIAILGEMLELGENSKQYHFEIGRYVIESGIDLIIIIGELAIDMYNAATEHKINDNQIIMYYETKEVLLDNIKKIKISNNDTVLVKASRGAHLELLVDYFKEF